MGRSKNLLIISLCSLVFCGCSAASNDYNAAVAKAEQEMQAHHRSKERLAAWLTTHDGGNFSEEAARYAADTVDVDWEARAVAIAANYINILEMTPEAAFGQMTAEAGDRIDQDMARRAIDTTLSSSTQ